MLLTYCRNDAGEEQLFLLPKGTLEAWLRPVGEDGRWVYESQAAEADMTPDFENAKSVPVRALLLDELAQRLGVTLEKLPDVAFSDIVRLATPPPGGRRQRVPVSRRKAMARNWVQATPER